MTGAFAVARYTLVELSRRRILLVFFILGAVGIGIVGFGLKIFSSSFATGISGASGPTAQAPGPATVNRFLELYFVSNLISALGLFALLIAFAIGMTVIYHDLDSGAAVAIFSKPVTRVAFTAGKLTAAIAAMLAIVGLLSVEARLLMFLFGSGDLEQTLWVETVAQVANALTTMLIVMALSTWMNNIVAAVVAFIYHGVAGAVVGLHGLFQSGVLGSNGFLKSGLDVAYWLVPHPLISDAQRELVRAEFEISPPPDGSTFDSAQALAGIPGASGAADVLWWTFVVVVLIALVYVAVRRRQV